MKGICPPPKVLHYCSIMKSIPFSPDWAIPTSASAVRQHAELSVQTVDTSLPVIAAEDDPISREVLVATLEGFGYHVTTTSEGHEAMEALRAQTRPVLAVIDWMMPGMSGDRNLSAGCAPPICSSTLCCLPREAVPNA